MRMGVTSSWERLTWDGASQVLPTPYRLPDAGPVGLCR